MQNHIYIITGASRGMGLAMAEQLLAAQNRLLCISRQSNPALAVQAEQHKCMLEQWTQDLSQPLAAADTLLTWLCSINQDELHSITLINNAAVLPTIAAMRVSAPAELALSLRVNLEAPMLLTAAFLQGTQETKAVRKVLNISSGLGRRAMASQAPYCAAKAGLDHFTRCLAIEEARHGNGAKVCSLAPGVIDTDMQVQLRSADANAFPDQAAFAQLKAAGQLATASVAAQRVLAWLARPDFGQQAIADVREAG